MITALAVVALIVTVATVVLGHAAALGARFSAPRPARQAPRRSEAPTARTRAPSPATAPGRTAR